MPLPDMVKKDTYESLLNSVPPSGTPAENPYDFILAKHQYG